MADWQSGKSARQSAYSEKLKDPRWQKKRLEVLSRDEWTCQLCFDSDSTLHVHHLDYERGKDPWDYPSERLLTLCVSCHDAETETRPADEASLLQTLRRRGFMSEDVGNIGFGLYHLPFSYPHYVMASALCWLMADEDQMEEVMDRYFAFLKEQNERRAREKAEREAGAGQ